MRFWKRILPIIVSSLIVVIGATTQQGPDFSSSTKPVVYGRVGDGFPDSISISGTIADVDFREANCGDIVTAGTLKIRPDTKIEDYRSEFVYAVVYCAETSDGKKYLGKKIEMSAVKLLKFPYTYSVFVSNKFDSMGVPFYLANGGGFGELDKWLR